MVVSGKQEDQAHEATSGCFEAEIYVNTKQQANDLSKAEANDQDQYETPLRMGLAVMSILHILSKNDRSNYVNSYWNPAVYVKLGSMLVTG